MGEARPIKVTVVDRRHHAQSETGDGDAERSPYPSFVEELRSRTEAAEKRAREAAERAEREIDAVRERLQRDVDRKVMQGRSGLLKDLLEVLDNLDRALASAEAAPAVEEGIHLVRRQLLGVLKAAGVEPIDVVGQPYDPNLAEAVMIEPVEKERHDQVVEVLQPGYLFGDTVLRPARVKVGKESSS
jgi:molecular chaperone GrpE